MMSFCQRDAANNENERDDDDQYSCWSQNSY